jgi:hypothetical protein
MNPAGHPGGSAADCLASAVVTGLNRGWAEGLQRPDRAGLVEPVRVGIDMAGRAPGGDRFRDIAAAVRAWLETRPGAG